MKKLMLLLLLSSGIVDAQIITISDLNFRTLLLNASQSNTIAKVNGFNVKIDTNNDGEIQISEAQIIDELNLLGNSIVNLAGVSSFNNLKKLDCSFNQLVVLDVTSLTSLIELKCQNNQIASLDVTMLVNLLKLNCSFNPITTLDVSNSPNLISLICTDTNATKLFLKNGSNDFLMNGQIGNNPNLVYVCIDQFNMLLAQNQVGSSVEVNTYCTFTPGGNYYTITGNIIFDADNNGCDATDLPQNNVRVNINDGTTTGATFVSNTGNYNFYTQAGSFDLTTDLENPTWFTASPITATIHFVNNNNNVTTQDFCISANGIHNDLEVVISPVMIARPGFDASYNIVYKNKGNQPLSGNVSFDYDDAVLDFVSSIVVPNTQTTGNLTWDYSNLMPFESRSILVTLNVNAPTETPAVNINDLLAFNAIITPVSGDEFPDDNSFSYVQTVVGAYDPNNIICIEGSVVAPATIGNYLHYAINFENTGNFEAENVVVKTTIDPAKFNINSLQLISTSAPVEARITNDIVEFIFKNINLPRSSGNPPVGGHGDVLFKIKTKPTLTAGSSVMNTAGIYFDYNFPINTNMATTTFANLSNSIFLKDDSISVFPNPTNSVVNINSKSEILTIELYDVQGRILETLVGNNRKIDISDKTNGIYFLKITTEKGSKVERIIRE